jgi:hypothetical protein
MKDSFEFVTKIIELHNSKNQKMISFHVDSLYNNVPVNEAMKIMVDNLFKGEIQLSISIDRMLSKITFELPVCDNLLRFLQGTCIQQDGVAVGSPLRLILAYIFMSHLK